MNPNTANTANLIVNGLIFLSNVAEAHKLNLGDFLQMRETAKAEGREITYDDVEKKLHEAQAAIDAIPED